MDELKGVGCPIVTENQKLIDIQLEEHNINQRANRNRNSRTN